jgi:hypothetical protein
MKIILMAESATQELLRGHVKCYVQMQNQQLGEWTGHDRAWKLVAFLVAAVRAEAEPTLLGSLTGDWGKLRILYTSWSIVLEKLPVAQLVKKFPAFYRTRRFINVFTAARHWALVLSQMNPVHTFPPYSSKIHSNIILPSTPRSSEWSLPFRFSSKNYVSISHLAYPIPLDLIALITVG